MERQSWLSSSLKRKRYFAHAGFVVAFTMMLPLILCSCMGKNKIKSETREFFAMDTFMRITVYGERCIEAADAILDEVKRLDSLLSIGNESSEISILNNNKELVVSEDVIYQINMAKKIYEMTEGAFDISILPVMEVWGFVSGNNKVPAKEEIDEALAKCGFDRISISADNKIILDKNQGIDFGGITKGYATDRIKKICEEYELVCANIDLGGNIFCYGTKKDGSPWRIAVKNPDKPDSSDYIGVVSITEGAVITSGAYQRFFIDEETKKKYHHIIDPATGYPVDSDLKSVTVVSSNATLADGLSTACFVMGYEKSVKLWEEHGKDEGMEFELILVRENNHVYVTEGLKNRFK